jgi:Cu2+-exporting ATPase
LRDDANKERILDLAAGVERESEHAIAKAIVAASSNRREVEGFQAIPGRGAEGKMDGKDVKVVSPGYLRENDIQYDESRTDKMRSRGDTVVYVLQDGAATGVIGLRDVMRPESRDAVRELRDRGLETLLITGDAEEVARHVAGEIGTDDYFAGILPDRKAQKIKEIQTRGKRVAMVGDGINDAPALAQADVGIAIGAGTDVAIETADIVLVNSDPRDVVRVLDHAHTTHKKTIQNLLWATAYNAVALPLAAGVLFSWGILLNPAVGALLMSMSTVIVAVNARVMRAPGGTSHDKP